MACEIWYVGYIYIYIYVYEICMRYGIYIYIYIYICGILWDSQIMTFSGKFSCI